MFVISHNLLINYGLTGHVFRCYNPGMGKKPIKVVEMASMGGLARALGPSKTQLRKWGKEGGRPPVLDQAAFPRLRKLLAKGKSQAECATILGVSVRTIGGLVARRKARSESSGRG